MSNWYARDSAENPVLGQSGPKMRSPGNKMLAQTLQKRPKPGEKRKLSPGFRSHLPGFSGYQGQIRHRSGHQQLEQGFSPAEVTRLADTQLPQASQAMLGGLSHVEIGR